MPWGILMGNLHRSDTESDMAVLTWGHFFFGANKITKLFVAYLAGNTSGWRMGWEDVGLQDKWTDKTVFHVL